MERKWWKDLSRTEREKFECLKTDIERNAFRILRNWSQTTKPDFKVHCESLGRRLAMSPRGAAKLRRKFQTETATNRTVVRNDGGRNRLIAGPGRGEEPSGG